jgi:hypothetical protein
VTVRKIESVSRFASISPSPRNRLLRYHTKKLDIAANIGLSEVNVLATIESKDEIIPSIVPINGMLNSRVIV